MIATWNLDRPWKNGRIRRADLHREQIRSVSADIWVLTETWGLRTLEVTSETLCAEGVPPNAAPLLVYGTIITWHRDPRAKTWVKHLEEVDRQTNDWGRLHRDHPSHRLIVAGDFNMTLHSEQGYGHRDGRRMVRERLPVAGLDCVTAIDIRDAAHGALDRDNIDHICIDQRLTLVAGPHTIPGSKTEGRRMSDHNGMVVEVNTEVASS